MFLLILEGVISSSMSGTIRSQLGFFNVRLLLQDQLKKWHEMIMPVEAVRVKSSSRDGFSENFKSSSGKFVGLTKIK